MSDETIAELQRISRAIARDQLRDRADAPPAGGVAVLFGYTFTVGELVNDTVTGVKGTILHATRRTLHRAAAQPQTG